MNVALWDERWVSPTSTLQDLRDTGLAFMDSTPERIPSYSTFVRVFHRSWAKKIKFRTEGQHAVCADCARWKEFRKHAYSREDVQRCKEGFQNHLASMMADRRVDAHLNQIAVDSVIGHPCESASTILSMTIDAMDSSKFVCPRNMGASKEFTHLHKPELRMVSVLVEGLKEHYFVLMPDLIKNSNLQMTLLTHAIATSFETLVAQGLHMPKELRVHSDNAPGEGKNQYMMKWAAHLVHLGYFEKATLSMFRCGHSHSKIDQRFSEVRGALCAATVLQTPDDFQKTITEHVFPRSGRSLSCDIIDASEDYKSYYEDLGVQVSGHTQTFKKFEQNLQAVHYFCFQKLGQLSEAEAQQVANPFGTTPQLNDIVLQTKLYLSSNELSQEPCIFCPASFYDRLAQDKGQLDPKPASPGAISQDSRKQFLKTATVVEKPPWWYHDAADFLREMANPDRARLPSCLQRLPTLHVWKDGQSLEASLFSGADFTWGDRGPAKVVVTAAKSKAKARAKAQAQPADQAGRVADGGEPQQSPPPGPPSPESPAVGKTPSPPPSPAAAPSTPLGEMGSLPGTPGTPRSDFSQKVSSFARNLKRPSASLPLNTAAKKGKAALKANTKAKAAPKGQAKTKVQVIIPAGVELGCSKCRMNTKIGCSQCRRRHGLSHDPATNTWSHQDV